MMLERKVDLEQPNKVLKGFATGLMKRIRTKMGKIIAMGAEQWWGHKIPKDPEWDWCWECETKHMVDFYGTVRQCVAWGAFRQQAKFEWENRTGCAFNEDLLWGRIRQTALKNLEKQQGHQAYRMMGGYLRWWEQTLQKRRERHSKKRHKFLASKGENQLVQEFVIIESGKISEKEAEYDTSGESLKSFRGRLKQIEQRIARTTSTGNKKEAAPLLKGRSPRPKTV